jgi:tight adherence protein B
VIARLVELGLAYGGIALAVAGVALVAGAVLRGETVLTRYYQRYTAYLDRSLRLLFLTGRGSRIALGQAAAAGACMLVALWLGEPLWLGLIPVIAVWPAISLARRKERHVQRLEGQVDALILGLANALKTVPSPSAALGQLALVLPSPMRLEVDRVLKEMRVGTTLEQGILNMSARLKSPELDTAFSSVLIGLQVGGNLPMVLENTAAAIREMSRLQGVVRTKTAEGRAQLWVLAVFPFVVCLALTWVDPNYFRPLQTTLLGSIVITIAMVLWMGSLLTARKILKVDI